MGIAQLGVSSGGLSVQRFEAAPNKPFQIPAGLTLQNTVTSTTTFSAGQLPAQVFVVMAGGGGGGSRDTGAGGGGGGTCIGWVDVPSAGITATIGAGGAGGVNAGAQYYGSPGGNTYFGSYVAYGGGGGMSTNDSWGSSSNGPLRQVFPRGIGAGYGGLSLTSLSGNNITYPFIEGCAPFLFSNTIIVPTGTSNLYRVTENYELYGNNYNGGGAGGTQAYNVNGTIGVGFSGLTGGGGTWNGSSTGQAGGNSSRNGGISNTFTGGIGNTGGYAGGGAGLLANGGDFVSGTRSGNGGSGGGGGGGVSSWSLQPGAGGAGCVLIYY